MLFLLSYEEISLENRTLPHCVRSSLETVPAEQEVQEAAPVLSVIEFLPHLVHLATVLSLYVPALHSTGELVLKY